eukprot:gene24422-29696_t
MIGLEVVEAKVAVAEVQAEIPGVTAEVAEVHAEIQGVTAEATAAAAQAVDPTEAEAGPRVEGAARVELEDGGNATWSPGHLLHSAARRFEGKLATWDSFKRNLVQDPLVYTRELGQLRQTAEPSRLQLLVKRGRNRLSQVITPHLSSNGMQFKDLFLDANTRSIQPITGPSILLTLTKAKEVPEIGNHQIHYRRVRLCLFDGVKFVGNVQVANVPPPLANRPYKWIMDQESSTFYVRSQERRKSLPLQ